MSETQETVSKWLQSTFPGTDPDSPRKSIRALEEMIELCLVSGATPNEIIRAVTEATIKEADKARQRMDESRFEPERIPAEVSDVDIVLDGIAFMRRFSRAMEKDKKMSINRSRRWKANGDGTGYHIKETTVGDLAMIDGDVA